jgi:RNA polymerase sigma-70 factor (ECF subfamily)
MAVNPMYHQTNQRMEEELSWIRRAQKDPECFGPLYKKYHEQIFRYVYQRMDDEETAFDVTSQVFMKALNNLNRYEFRGVPFSSWLYRIAKVSCTNHSGIKKRRELLILKVVNSLK